MCKYVILRLVGMEKMLVLVGFGLQYAQKMATMMAQCHSMSYLFPDFQKMGRFSEDFPQGLAGCQGEDARRLEMRPRLWWNACSALPGPLVMTHIAIEHGQCIMNVPIENGDFTYLCLLTRG